MVRPLVVSGGGGMGRCVLDVVDALNAQEPAQVEFTIGIASGTVRRRIARYAHELGRRSTVLVHPNVHRGFDVRRSDDGDLDSTG